MNPQEFIAHYRIVSKLGEGGMGAVYRATDTKLNREVAIKVLPDGLANDPSYLARFQREAQVLASLNHPNLRPCAAGYLYFPDGLDA
jgi:serine/threonine protein kinase